MFDADKLTEEQVHDFIHKMKPDAWMRSLSDVTGKFDQRMM